MSSKKRSTKKSTAPARSKTKATKPESRKKSTAPKRTKRQTSKKAGKPAKPETADQVFASLAPKQQRFVLEYLANGFNGTRAAIAAGYAKANADTQASRMLASPKIAAVVRERTRKVTEKLELTAEWVLGEIHKMAAFDPRRLFYPDGSLIPVTELDDGTAMSIAGVDVIEREDGSRLKKIKIADKGKNLERLGRHFKLFTDKVEHSGKLKIERILVPAKPSPPAKKEVKPDFG